MSATTTTPHDCVVQFDDGRRVGLDFKTNGDEIAQAQLDEYAEHLRARAAQVAPKQGREVRHGRPADVLAAIDEAPAAYAESCRPVGAVLAQAAGVNPTTGDAYYSADDVVAWVARVFELGATSVPRIGPAEIEDVFRLRRVPNAKLRAEYERHVEEGKDEGLLTRIAQAVDPDARQPDTSHVLRFLGVEVTTAGSRGDCSVRLFCSADQAAAAATVLGLDFHDLGI